MAFRPRKKFPEFADLKAILAQSRQQLDHATYQTIATLIDRLAQYKLENERRLDELLEEINELIDDIDAAGDFYDSPLTDGDEDETDLIFADGDCIICQVPNVP